jgi:hypothetical protein
MKKLLLVVGLLSLASCAHHRDVRAGADGIHKVIVREEEKEEAEQSAISQANHFCEEQQKHAAFIEEKSQYTGKMDEGTRDTVRKASKAAAVVGGTLGTFGEDRGTRNAGGIVGLGGVAGGVMTSGKDYTAEMKFKCQ